MTDDHRTVTGRMPARSGHILEYPRGRGKAFTLEERVRIERLDFSEIEHRILLNLNPRDRILMNFHLKRIALPFTDPKRTVLKEVEYMLMYGATAKVARIWYVHRLAELKQ